MTSVQDYKDRQPSSAEQQHCTIKGVVSIIDVVIALGQRGIPLRGNWDPSKRNEDGISPSLLTGNPSMIQNSNTIWIMLPVMLSTRLRGLRMK